ncbi:hypothetical protein ACQQ2N_05990 [Dokdonella sp. MW10]|uniref:hypothetical protein n=1 Tax=Dokdonella sp. MW10 TaxID=2992926 RepID=UPI003F7DCB8C
MLRTPAILVLLSLSTASVADTVPPPPLEPAQEDAALRMAEQTGVLLYRHDQAASVATDALAKVRGFKRDKRMEGWITEAQADGIQVTFFGRDKGQPLAAFHHVRVDAGGNVIEKTSSPKSPEPLTTFEAEAAEARSIAKRTSFQPCTEQYNTVVLPKDAGAGQWTVHLLPATTKKGVVPIGGSYRVDVDIRSGDAVVRPYTKTCLQLEDRKDVAALMVSHLLDPLPTDVHVFWSLWVGKRIYVVTNGPDNLFAVSGGTISRVERPASP